MPAGFPETRLRDLKLRSREYILVAIRDQESWRFNPDEDETVKSGNTLVLMPTPQGRAAVERVVGWV